MDLIKKYKINHVNFEYFCVSHILKNIFKYKIRPTTFLKHYNYKNNYDYKKINNKLYFNKKALKNFFCRNKYTPIDILKFFKIKKDTYKIERDEVIYTDAIINFLQLNKDEYIKQLSISADNKKYFIDLYIPKYKIAFEIDEQQHNNKKNKNNDIIRENEIKKILDCIFLRYDVNKNIYNFLGDIHKFILNRK